MILVDGRTYPLIRGLVPYNTVFVSPWTGEIWARIDRGCREWFPQRWAARREHPFPSSDSTPGSLVTLYDEWRDGLLRELPRELLLREVSLIEGLTSATISCDNGATNGEMLMTPDLLKDIAMLRGKLQSGTITDQELRDAIVKLREGRQAAVSRQATSRAKAKVAVNPDDALAAFLS